MMLGRSMKLPMVFFNSRLDIKKPRKVAAIHQRKDNAIAVVKLHSDKGQNKSNFVKGVVLKPNKHSSLSVDTIVENTLYFGRKKGSTYTKINSNDLTDLHDKLSLFEYLKIKSRVNAKTKKNKKTRNKTLKRWKRFFK